MNKMMLKKQYMSYSTNKKGRLPSGFQEVEYIQSTGTQYIDTGIKATNATRFKIDVEITAYDTYIFGAWNDWQVSMFTIYSANSSSSAIGYGANWVGSITGLTTGNKITISIDNGVVKYNNEIKGSYPDTFTSANNIILCGTNASGTPTAFSKIKIYSLEIDGHNFIPCYRKSDNEVGLYDIVNNQFYTNAGSGTFLKGANV